MADKNENKEEPRLDTEDAAADVLEDMDEPAAEMKVESGDVEDELDEDVEEPSLTPEERLQQERDDFEDKWLRSVAELENMRRRSRRDVVDAHRFATADVLRPLLDVLDNFERALDSIAEPEDDAEESEAPDMAKIRSGIEMIQQSFKSVLQARGLSPIEAEGEQFDPNLHEALQEMDVEGVESGVVTDVVQTGYTLNDMVLRPSRVVVAR